MVGESRETQMKNQENMKQSSKNALREEKICGGLNFENPGTKEKFAEVL